MGYHQACTIMPARCPTCSKPQTCAPMTLTLCSTAAFPLLSLMCLSGHHTCELTLCCITVSLLLSPMCLSGHHPCQLQPDGRQRVHGHHRLIPAQPQAHVSGAMCRCWCWCWHSVSSVRQVLLRTSGSEHGTALRQASRCQDIESCCFLDASYQMLLDSSAVAVLEALCVRGQSNIHVCVWRGVSMFRSMGVCAGAQVGEHACGGVYACVRGCAFLQ